MKFVNMLAGSMVAVSLVAAPALLAAEPGKMSKMDKMGGMEKMGNMDEFMKACDMDHDGMMSKTEMMKHMETMFDKMDTRKTGKLDKKQTAELLKQLTQESGG
jgi:hypothetical protein